MSNIVNPSNKFIVSKFVNSQSFILSLKFGYLEEISNLKYYFFANFFKYKTIINNNKLIIIKDKFLSFVILFLYFYNTNEKKDIFFLIYIIKV